MLDYEAPPSQSGNQYTIREYDSEVAKEFKERYADLFCGDAHKLVKLADAANALHLSIRFYRHLLMCENGPEILWDAKGKERQLFDEIVDWLNDIGTWKAFDAMVKRYLGARNGTPSHSA